MTAHGATAMHPKRPADAPFVVRFKAPQSGETVIDDLVQGRIATANDQFDDLILLRSDGTPTYMLSVVVDDHDMAVTHIIRGDDHMTNAARQAQIYAALGWDVPQFAHIPLIHGPDGAKLSKRHGALGVEAYRDMGYLPEAMRNYLARLGWSHGDDEVFSTAQLIEWFGLEAIGKSPARFDTEKLDNVNAQHLNMADDAALVAETVAYSIRRWPIFEGATDGRHAAFEDARATRLPDIAADAAFLAAERPIAVDEKLQKHLNEENATAFAGSCNRLEALENWTSCDIETMIKAYMDDNELKMGKLAPCLSALLLLAAANHQVFSTFWPCLAKTKRCSD